MNLSANDAASCHCRSVDTPRSTPRWPHDMVDVWSAECAHEELMRCLDHCCYRLGNSAARHELMTISLPSSSQRCRLAQTLLDLRNTERLSDLSFLSAVLDGAQPPMVVVPHRRLWHTAWTAADVLCSANPTVRSAPAARRFCYGFDSRPCATSQTMTADPTADTADDSQSIRQPIRQPIQPMTVDPTADDSRSDSRSDSRYSRSQPMTVDMTIDLTQPMTR